VAAGRIGYHFTFRRVKRGIRLFTDWSNALEVLQFLQHNWMVASIALISGALLLWPYVHAGAGGARKLGTLAVTQLINKNNALLLDVREPKEFSGGKLPNAVHIPLSELKGRGQELAKFTKRPVVAYCARGASSRGAPGLLKGLGFTEIYELQGGVQAWKDAGLPLERE
jgi:rhodanese-related sulfurtransferase